MAGCLEVTRGPGSGALLMTLLSPMQPSGLHSGVTPVEPIDTAWHPNEPDRHHVALSRRGRDYGSVKRA
jgi:hypothetical protein